MAALLYAAHALEAMPVDHAILAGARHKIEMGATEIFFKGIFANGIVCLAVWLNLQLRNESAKLFETILVIFIFLYLGFEHSIANMGTFSIALMADPSLSLAGIGHNLLWSTLGNIVGGAMIGIAAIGAKLPKS
jgi:nitrite transporter NirC